MPHKKTVRAGNTSAADSAPGPVPAGLYLRLSGREKAAGEKLENQKELLLHYVKSRKDLKAAGIYPDNGESGTNFDRPEWKRLMEDIKAKRISCIVVKDLSRFGRNYVETGYYLETVFPSLNVRFISVNDRYDSENAKNSGLQPLDTVIKGIVNEAYARDISRKIFTAKEIQRKNGLYYGNLPPYGYRKDPENPHRLIINQENFDVVQTIFRWKLQRAGNLQIARRLNSLNIPSPMRYQFLTGAVKAPRFENSLWQSCTVKMILRNRTYTGDLAMGKKRRNLSENLVRTRSIPQQDWMITENTHQAIISREIYSAVQDICMQETAKRKGKEKRL